MTQPRTISIMGATGSIGQSAVSIVRDANAKARDPVFQVETVASGRDARGLAGAARACGAKTAIVADEGAYPALRDALAGSGIEAAAGQAAICEAAAMPVDRVLAAIVGSAGLHSTLAALEAGNDVALANKESIVCAGTILMAAAKASGARIIPVDSEHNAIFQVLDTARAPESLILTASGGPFRRAPLEALATVTPAQAAAHPNWSMGFKNSVDSATMMNKALELIEACYLFGVPEQMVEVVIHPQSIIHSLVRYPDGSTLAQLSVPDMRVPIAHALMWPEPIETGVPRLDLVSLASLTFEAVDPKRFPAIGLARRAARLGCRASTVLNSANEVAVAAFAAGQCRFLDIASTVNALLERFEAGELDAHDHDPDSLDGVLALDALARRVAGDLLVAHDARG